MKEETLKMESIEDGQWMKHATHRGDLSQPNPRVVWWLKHKVYNIK